MNNQNYTINDVIIPDGYEIIKKGELIPVGSYYAWINRNTNWVLSTAINQKREADAPIENPFVTDITIYIKPKINNINLSGKPIEFKQKPVYYIPDGYIELEPDDIITHDHRAENMNSTSKNINTWVQANSSTGQIYKDRLASRMVFIKKIPIPPVIKNIDGVDITLTPEQIKKLNDHKEKIKLENDQYLYKKGDILINICSHPSLRYIKFKIADGDGDTRNWTTTCNLLRKATKEEIEYYNKIMNPNLQPQSIKIEIK